MTTPLRLFILTAFLLAGATLRASEAEWLTNFNDATKAAKERNTLVFALFTGSEWCPPCIQFERNVLSKPEWAEYANQKVVLLMVDLPRGDNHKISKKQRSYNEALAGKYGIRGVPTIILFDNRGKEITRSGAMGSVAALTGWLDGQIAGQSLEPTAAGSAGTGGAAQEARVWVDKRGRSVRGLLVEKRETTVILQTMDGKQYEVPIDTLSAADRNYIDKIE